MYHTRKVCPPPFSEEMLEKVRWWKFWSWFSFVTALWELHRYFRTCLLVADIWGDWTAKDCLEMGVLLSRESRRWFLFPGYRFMLRQEGERIAECGLTKYLPDDHLHVRLLLCLLVARIGFEKSQEMRRNGLPITACARKDHHARTYFAAAANHVRQVRCANGKSDCYREMAEIQLLLGDRGEARELVHKAISISDLSRATKQKNLRASLRISPEFSA